MIDDADHIENVERMRETLMTALAAGHKTVKFELDVFGWLMLLDEVQDRRPRNYSALVRDDAMDRLEDSIEWLQAEIRAVMAHGQSNLAGRFDGRRIKRRHAPPAPKGDFD
jgi:hypothetical protein